MKKTVLQVLITVLLIMTSALTFAKTNSEILVNEKGKSLYAPEGKQYQWFYEGMPLNGETTQELDEINASGHYSVNYTSEDGIEQVEEVMIVASTQAIHKIFLIGDSTVTNYKASVYPMMGWGQVLGAFINNNAFTIDNRAIGGRSSRSFWEEGRWTEVKAAMTAGDFLFIQFGHNDRDFSKPERYTSTTDYKTYLKIYVNESRALGVIPVLVTPMVLNAWRNGVLRNVFTESGNDYRGAMIEVANELKVPLIDLNMKSWNYESAAGMTYDTRYISNTYLAGEYPNYPNGLNDYTHFQEMGALLMAKFVAEGIKELSSNNSIKSISDALTPQYLITVTSNNNAAGLITKSETYPKGVTVTLKALTNSGHTFLYWKDANDNIISTDSLHTVIVGTSATTYKAIFDKDTDCAGVLGGTAKKDKCGICSGGNTGLPACTALIEGEEACAVDGILSESTNTGFIGTGYANTDNVLDASIRFEINSAKSKNTTLYIRYANGGTTNRDGVLLVNGADVATSLFPTTGNWSTWKTTSLNVNLQSGKNTIVLKANSTGGLPNIDALFWADNDISSSTCIITSINEAKAESISILPNPFEQNFSIESKIPFSYKIYNELGSLIQKGSCNGSCELGENLKSGVYEIVISTEKSIQTTKIVKK